MYLKSELIWRLRQPLKAASDSSTISSVLVWHCSRTCQQAVNLGFPIEQTLILTTANCLKSLQPSPVLLSTWSTWHHNFTSTSHHKTNITNGVLLCLREFPPKKSGVNMLNRSHHSASHFSCTVTMLSGQLKSELARSYMKVNIISKTGRGRFNLHVPILEHDSVTDLA